MNENSNIDALGLTEDRYLCGLALE